MTIIALPDAATISNVEINLDQPAQVNRSDWTKRRQVVSQPGPSLWSATAQLATKVGDDDGRLDVDAFLVGLEGQRNSFRLEISAKAQAPDNQLPDVDGNGQSGRSLHLRNGIPGSFLRPGHKMTVNDQPVVLMGYCYFDDQGKGVATFIPSLRAIPADGDAVEVRRPTMLVSLTTSSIGWSEDPGGVFKYKQLVLEEAF